MALQFVADVWPFGPETEPSGGTGTETAASDPSRIRIEWLPEYGAAVVAVAECGAYSAPLRHVQVVGLDDWSFAVHASADAREAAPACRGFATLAASPVPAAEYDAVLGRLRGLLRQSARGKTPRTPGLVAALLRQATDGGEAPVEGGFTDVGGGPGSDDGGARATAWPLVRAVFALLLDQADVRHSEELFEKCMAYLDLWLCEGQLQRTLPALSRCGGHGGL